MTDVNNITMRITNTEEFKDNIKVGSVFYIVRRRIPGSIYDIISYKLTSLTGNEIIKYETVYNNLLQKPSRISTLLENQSNAIFTNLEEAKDYQIRNNDDYEESYEDCVINDSLADCITLDMERYQ